MQKKTTGIKLQEQIENLKSENLFLQQSYESLLNEKDNIEA